MNIENDYVTGINEVTLTDSLNAPLIYLRLKVDDNTVIPNDNNLIIYIDKSSKTNPSQDKKTYIFSLPYILSLNSEFIIDSKINNNFLSMVSYVNINGEITELSLIVTIFYFAPEKNLHPIKILYLNKLVQI